MMIVTIMIIILKTNSYTMLERKIEARSPLTACSHSAAVDFTLHNSLVSAPAARLTKLLPVLVCELLRNVGPRHYNSPSYVSWLFLFTSDQIV